MGLPSDRPAAALLPALGLGFALGLVYDLLRPLRCRAGRTAAALLDAAFSLLSGAAAFLFAMGAGEGRFGLWELAAALLGFLLWLHVFSPVFQAGAARINRVILNITTSYKKVIVERKKHEKNTSKI